MGGKRIRNGRETHQLAEGNAPALTTNHWFTVSDSLKSGALGPRLLEDFVLREKIVHRFALIPDAGVTSPNSAFLKAASQRFCDREPSLRTLA